MRFGKIVVVLLVLVLSVSLFGNEYREVRNISLSKDEIKQILIKYDRYERVLQFRWTLYKNGGLVIFRSYDRSVAQNILYLNHKNQSFRVVLKPKGVSYSPPYILIKFVKFDYKKDKAEFQLFLSDDDMQIELEYLKNR